MLVALCFSEVFDVYHTIFRREQRKIHNQHHIIHENDNNYLCIAMNKSYWNLHKVLREDTGQRASQERGDVGLDDKGVRRGRKLRELDKNIWSLEALVKPLRMKQAKSKVKTECEKRNSIYNKEKIRSKNHVGNGESMCVTSTQRV